ncbi:hypothetical protein Gohar_025068 [Gossypium harknessii]|uniref:Myb/SANT-like domain-containing protein n=1 Tax=Gossypium harknessii TaxID=34285 RepID=A0A7J9HHW3_9ROSI|nr:hypothetical protein [Gossypium harknessii]
MVDLHNVGTFIKDTRFKVDYLNKLERMLEKVLPHAMLKAKPNLESRIRTLKRDWAIVYNILSGKDNSGFSWDEHRQLVIAEDVVWNSYISDVASANTHEERNNFYGCEADVSLDEMDLSATQSQPSRN